MVLLKTREGCSRYLIRKIKLRVIPQWTVDNNLGLGCSKGPKALDPIIEDNQPFDCAKCVYNCAYEELESNLTQSICTTEIHYGPLHYPYNLVHLTPFL